MKIKGNLGWVALGANTIVAIIVPILIITKTGNEIIPILTSLILSFLSFIVLSCIELLIYNQRQHSENIWWKINETSDSQLHNIRMDVHEVNKESNSDENDLFYFYLHKKIGELQELAKNATSHQEIKIDGAMLETTERMYNSAFNGQNNDIFRAVFLCDSETDFFFNGQLVKKYFEWSFDRVRSGKIKKIKRLFIYNMIQPETNIDIKRLIIFHQKNDNYECKKISSSLFDRLKKDFDLTELQKSFGIYGEKYLYTERKEDFNQVVGLYSKNKDKIKKYTDFFDKCWDNADGIPTMEMVTDITLDINYVFTTNK